MVDVPAALPYEYLAAQKRLFIYFFFNNRHVECISVFIDSSCYRASCACVNEPLPFGGYQPLPHSRMRTCQDGIPGETPANISPREYSDVIDISLFMRISQVIFKILSSSLATNHTHFHACTQAAIAKSRTWVMDQIKH